MSLSRYFTTYAVGVASMLAGAAVVHTIMKPDVVRGHCVCGCQVAMVCVPCVCVHADPADHLRPVRRRRGVHRRCPQ